MVFCLCSLYCGISRTGKTYSQYKEKGLDILLISIDKSMDDFQAAMKKYQIKFTSLIDTTEGEKVKRIFLSQVYRMVF